LFFHVFCYFAKQLKSLLARNWNLTVVVNKASAARLHLFRHINLCFF